MRTCAYIVPKQDFENSKEEYLRRTAKEHLHIDTGMVKKIRVMEFHSSFFGENEEDFVRSHIVNPVTHSVHFETAYTEQSFQGYCLVAKKHGITDDESRCAELLFQDRFGVQKLKVFSHDLFLIEKDLPEDLLEKLSSTVLGNSLIHDFSYGREKISGPFVREEKSCLEPIFKDREVNPYDLALNEEEVKAIHEHFALPSVQLERKKQGLSKISPCEWEILAQTWSEHCKHKEFNAEIRFKDLDTGEIRTIDSLFKSKIREATQYIDEQFKKHSRSFLLKVFNDNAGIVRVDEKNLFVWKVETHNTPSALDPYGGAMTGVLGVNRDALGTGVGGARLLFNTNVLCFGPPDYKKALIKGQKHPSYIQEGVVRGIKDAGNHSGVPTINGSIIYDERYSGKPLVFCGTGALMPHSFGEKNTWDKNIEAGDKILMLGGRVGKDGIHGATASSMHADEHTPSTIVQIGSPFTQKKLSDYLEYVCRKGLIKTCTDNGAGGLSSSVGELSEFSGGATVYLDKVPLKYPGLEPWEIFVSESQERMTLVCEPEKVPELSRCALEWDVELSDIGEFTESGYLDVRYKNRQEAYINLDFLHNGLPKKQLEAEWKRPAFEEPETSHIVNFNECLLDLLSSDNICSRKAIIRQYDHEVKGKTIIKPLMGLKQNAPQDAGVMRLDFDSYRGLAVSNGIIPRYGDIDPYQMSAGSFDEAVRQIIAVGGKLPDAHDPHSPFWSVNDNFCMPNAVYDPAQNPDGKLKLGKLVRMCDALYDMSTFFLVPMTSGKDSMKNDFGYGEEKISIAPTVLYSMVSGIEDVRKTLTSQWKSAGDCIYLLGQTYDELGASEFYKLLGFLGNKVPHVRPEHAKRLYQKFSSAHEKGWIASAHDLSDGGLAVALAESCIGSGIGVHVEMFSELSNLAELFSESHSRFLISIKEDHRSSFESMMGKEARFLGWTQEAPRMKCSSKGTVLLDLPIESLSKAWEREEA